MQVFLNLLDEEQEKKRKELRLEELEKVRNSGDTMGADLANLYGRLEVLSSTNRAERQKLYREVAEKLGEVRYIEDKPEPKANSYIAYAGTISMHGLLCELRWANFSDPQGIVSFTQWLCDKGCLQFKYDLEQGGGWSNGEELEEEVEGL